MSNVRAAYLMHPVDPEILAAGQPKRASRIAADPALATAVPRLPRLNGRCHDGDGALGVRLDIGESERTTSPADLSRQPHALPKA